MAMLRVLAPAFIVASAFADDVVTIHKVDYPVSGLCGEEKNVTKSNLNPHYYFPMHFGGFHEGSCGDAGFPRFEKTVIKAMHPFPGISHNLTFDLYARSVGPVYEVSFQDSARDRTVYAKICLPPTDRGEKLPLYVFGHGFDCRPDDYAYFCKTAAVAMVYGRNTTFIDFDTKNLAGDAAFLAKELPRLSREDADSLVGGRLGGPVVFGGHSMGGGTSVLSASQSGDGVADGMALFAPGLYTHPSATPFLKDVKLPTLIVSGSYDCGPNQLPKQAQPAFDGLASTRKVLLVLKGANHCQWADTIEGEGGVCAKEECHLIDGPTQRQLGVDLASAFMDGLEDDAAWGEFEKALAAGEAKGTWTYFSSNTSASSKTLQNDCPCGTSMADVGQVNSRVDIVV